MAEEILIEPGKINFEASLICNILKAAGHEAYIVGGCVRDLVLGRQPKDWDICTSANPKQITAAFAADTGYGALPTGIKHGTLTVMNPRSSEHFEVTTYRVDGPYSDGRHPDNVEFVSDLRSDLSRRDFTMNAMAASCGSDGFWHVVDPFGGLADIKSGVVRCVGNPYDRFAEDGLRLMRAIRFCCQLAFSMDSDTRTALYGSVSSISNVSAERIRDELAKILVTVGACTGLHLLQDSGIMHYICLEIALLPLVEQSLPWHIYNVFDHTLTALFSIVTDTMGTPDLNERLAILFHDTGKMIVKKQDPGGVWHFHGHPVESEKLTRNALARLRFDNATIDEVASLVLLHDVEFTPTKSAVRRIMRKLARPDLFPSLVRLRKADVLAQSLRCRGDRIERADRCLELYHEIAAESSLMHVTDLTINGNDALELGYKGPEIGKVLNDLLLLVIDEVVANDRNKLLALMKFKKGAMSDELDLH